LSLFFFTSLARRAFFALSLHDALPIFGVWIALLVGTYLTYAVAKLDLGPYNAAVALIIATTKALLVALFFMHLKGASERLLKLVDRKSTRLNSSHLGISYAVFCLKKKT